MTEKTTNEDSAVTHEETGVDEALLGTVTEDTTNEDEGSRVSSELTLPEEKAPNKVAVFILWALSAFFPLIGIIFAYIKKSSACDEFEKSHCSYAIRTFWWGLLWGIIGAILAVFVIGVPIILAATIWYVYRIVKGVVRACDGKPVY